MAEEMTNIVSTTIDEVVDIYTQLVTSAIKNGYKMSQVRSTFLWGAPGVGKSQGINQLASRLEKETGKTVKVTDIRLLLFNPVDLRGIPSANADKTKAVWLNSIPWTK